VKEEDKGTLGDNKEIMDIGRSAASLLRQVILSMADINTKKCTHSFLNPS
jgi:hypothetical protein